MTGNGNGYPKAGAAYRIRVYADRLGWWCATVYRFGAVACTAGFGGCATPDEARLLAVRWIAGKEAKGGKEC